MRVFYVRVSTEEQNEARQVKAAEEIGAEKIFIDKASGKNADRQQLKEMLAFVREGDIVYCSDISRIARNTKDLLSIVEELKKKKVDFRDLFESFTKDYVVVTFLSILSMSRNQEIEIEQENNFNNIIIKEKGVK